MSICRSLSLVLSLLLLTGAQAIEPRADTPPTLNSEMLDFLAQVDSTQVMLKRIDRTQAVIGQMEIKLSELKNALMDPNFKDQIAYYSQQLLSVGGNVLSLIGSTRFMLLNNGNLPLLFGILSNSSADVVQVMTEKLDPFSETSRTGTFEEILFKDQIVQMADNLSQIFDLLQNITVAISTSTRNDILNHIQTVLVKINDFSHALSECRKKY